MVKKTLFSTFPLLCFGWLFAQSPGGVGTNLEFWLKGNSGVTGAAPITAWVDQSGKGITNTVSGNPTLSSSTLNYNDVVSFDGAGGYFTTNLNINEATFPDLSVIAVYKPNVNTSGGVWGEDNGNWDRFLLDGNTSSLNNMVSNGSGALTNISNIFVTSTPVITSTIFDEDVVNGSFVYANSNQVLNFTSNHGPEVSNTMQIGSIGKNDFNFNGDIAECMVYSQLLSASDRNKIESYLAIKYGITLDNSAGAAAGDYTSSSGKLLWDADLYTIYHNNVAGIGRDDDAGLDQRKSIGSTDDIVIMDKGAAFGSDEDFILWGNNKQGTSTTTTNAHPSYPYLLNQKWITAVTGTPGNVTVSFILLNSGTASDYALLLDTVDTDFSSGAIVHTAGASINGDTITFTSVALTDSMFFTLGTHYETPSPGGIISNLEFWLKVDAGTNSTADEAEITSWKDQAKLIACTGGVGTSPTYETNGINYNSVLNFNGSDERLLITNVNNLPSGNDARSAFVVGRPDVTSGSWRWTYTHGTATVNQSSGFGQNNGTGYYIGYGNDESSTSYFSNNEPFLGGGYYDGVNASIGKSGEILSTTARAAWNTTNTIGYVGASAADNERWSGDIAEIIVYKDNLSEVDRIRVQSYLAIKYGITTTNDNDGDATTGEAIGGFTEGDYIAGDGSTVIWDYSNNPTYHNNVIGIGRDDTEQLNQKQSKTSDDSLIVYIDNLTSSNTANAGTITNDDSYLMIGNNGGALMATVAGNTEKPSGIVSRLEREWKITNTNFTNTFSLVIEWDSVGTFDVNDIRLLVDADGDFANATVLSAADGLSFSTGSIVVEHISTAHIPANSTRYFTIGSADIGTPLPVELIHFTADVTESNWVELAWQTATEINSDYFTVERSLNLTDWEELSRLKAADNSNLVLNYDYTDTEPHSGFSYYRLKQTDFDGKFSYSSVKTIQIGLEKISHPEIYPNPTSNVIHITRADSNLRVYNSYGQELTALINIDYSENSITTVDLVNLNSGMYFINTGGSSYKVLKK